MSGKRFLVTLSVGVRKNMLKRNDEETLFPIYVCIWLCVCGGDYYVCAPSIRNNICRKMEKNVGTRQLGIVLLLNPDWKAGDGSLFDLVCFIWKCMGLLLFETCGGNYLQSDCSDNLCDEKRMTDYFVITIWIFGSCDILNI